MLHSDSLHQLRNSFSRLAQRRALLVLPALLLMGATSINCSDDPSSNDTTSASSSSSSSSSGEGGTGGAGGAAPQSVVGTFRIFDGQTTAAIAGAPVAFGAEMKQTDVDGQAMFNLMPGSPYEVIASATQYLPIHLFGITGNVDFKSSRGLLSEMTVGQLAGALGETYDPTKAIVTANAAGSDLKSLSESIQVDPDVTYGFAAVPDKSNPAGFSKGNASLAGDTSTVFLMNVEPGPVALTVTLQSGKKCTVFPSSMPQGSEKLIAYAHEISTVSFVCQ